MEQATYKIESHGDNKYIIFKRTSFDNWIYYTETDTFSKAEDTIMADLNQDFVFYYDDTGMCIGYNPNVQK
jgi:hypothetical protein